MAANSQNTLNANKGAENGHWRVPTGKNVIAQRWPVINQGICCSCGVEVQDEEKRHFFYFYILGFIKKQTEYWQLIGGDKWFKDHSLIIATPWFPRVDFSEASCLFRVNYSGSDGRKIPAITARFPIIEALISSLVSQKSSFLIVAFTLLMVLSTVNEWADGIGFCSTFALFCHQWVQKGSSSEWMSAQGINTTVTTQDGFIRRTINKVVCFFFFLWMNSLKIPKEIPVRACSGHREGFAGTQRQWSPVEVSGSGTEQS